MTDRPIIFSGSMVRALLDGRKTQTRRLATSPLRRCEVGDRLYVREAWHAARSLDSTPPRDIPRDADIEHATTARSYAEIGLKGKLRPGMHMPRWASRLTLTVTDVRVQPLCEITDVDAIAEGLTRAVVECGDGVLRDMYFGIPQVGHEVRIADAATDAYFDLWDSLHNPQGYCAEDQPAGAAANPSVVALTFTVTHGNIDAVQS